MDKGVADSRTAGTNFYNLNYLDVVSGCLRPGFSIYVEAGKIVEIARGRLQRPGSIEIDLKGRTVMPGLIDCHVHSVSDLSGTERLPSTQALLAGKRLFRMLRRGFTTVRDAGGADAGFKAAINQRAIPGPRMFISGKALSQTGGHGDPRSPFDLLEPCGCGRPNLGFGRLADGVPDFLKAAREELRLGADQIKIVASGGVGSAAGSLNQAQLSDDEVRAIVDEATRAGTYVMAHVYSAAGVKRLVELGVRTIEHGNLIDEGAAKAIAARGAYLVPNLVAYQSLAKFGKAQGYPAAGLARLETILDAGARSLELARAAGVKIGYGSDLVKDPESQSDEFLIRSEIMQPIEIIRSATLVGAEIVRMAGQIGVIQEGAIADLLVIDGDPLTNINLLTEQGKHIPLIMKDGWVEKNALEADLDEPWMARWFTEEKRPQ